MSFKMREKDTTHIENQGKAQKLPSSNSAAEEEISTASPFPEALDG